MLVSKSKAREGRRRKRRGRRIVIRIDTHDHHYYDKIAVRRHYLSSGCGGIYIGSKASQNEIHGET